MLGFNVIKITFSFNYLAWNQTWLVFPSGNSISSIKLPPTTQPSFSSKPSIPSIQTAGVVSLSWLISPVTVNFGILVTSTPWETSIPPQALFSKVIFDTLTSEPLTNIPPLDELVTVTFSNMPPLTSWNWIPYFPALAAFTVRSLISTFLPSVWISIYPDNVLLAPSIVTSLSITTFAAKLPANTIVFISPSLSAAFNSVLVDTLIVVIASNLFSNAVLSSPAFNPFTNVLADSLSANFWLVSAFVTAASAALRAFSSSTTSLVLTIFTSSASVPVALTSTWSPSTNFEVKFLPVTNILPSLSLKTVLSVVK